ncbi:TMV resistance protein N-like [Dorcoceras hygrometricum]|uniref:TMV resistance protein N-like n=1 Tax=Dorcoceras hygrometricum TaxID=472368 RepID=A0A2Z7BX20_9LAMI|nr:TMV resistance protein N-like [Dorcoceras hygrometricum]
MAVASRIGSEETVTSEYVVPLIELSSDEEEWLYGEARSCGRKAKSINIGRQLPVAAEKVKRMKLCNVTTTAVKTTDLENVGDKLNTNDIQEKLGPTAPIIIDISDDSSA